jgi:hypothetical protein
MPFQPSVTVIGATRNARTATRLTYASFRRHTPERPPTLVADNGSTDGILADLKRTPWLRVFSLEERKRELSVTCAEAQCIEPALAARLDRFAAQLPPNQRALLDKMRVELDFEVPPDEELRHHAPALDWLTSKVATPFFVLLDSDVEFLASGWLSDLVTLAEREGLAAVGEYEGPYHPCRPRLATYLLFIRTEAFKSLSVPFQSRLIFGHKQEERRWYSSTRNHVLDPSKFDGYPSAAFYDTGALFFEKMQQAGLKWATFPDSIASKFRHLGQMTWSADADDDYVGIEYLRDHVRTATIYAKTRLQLLYREELSQWTHT